MQILDRVPKDHDKDTVYIFGHANTGLPVAMRDPLKGFESFGRFGQANARDPLTCAYEEVTTGR